MTETRSITRRIGDKSETRTITMANLPEKSVVQNVLGDYLNQLDMKFRNAKNIELQNLAQFKNHTSNNLIEVKNTLVQMDKHYTNTLTTKKEIEELKIQIESQIKNDHAIIDNSFQQMKENRESDQKIIENRVIEIESNLDWSMKQISKLQDDVDGLIANVTLNGINIDKILDMMEKISNNMNMM